MEAYPERYATRLGEYWEKDFPKAKFKSEDELVYFCAIVKKMLEKDDPHLKEIAEAKLKRVKGWEHRGTYFIDILEKKGIKTNRPR